MRPEDLAALRTKNLITEAQHAVLEPIISRKIVSVFYELRTLLYLGVLLFSTGMGILIYENIGELGHLLAIIALFALTIACFAFALLKAVPYTHEKVRPPSPYYDYIVLLGCLLFISGLTYLQIQYEVFDNGLGAVTFVTAAFFFLAAYRFDHLGVLSLAITALASCWGISLSPQKWYSNDFLSESDLHITALIFSAVVTAAALALNFHRIKNHFTFTYLNFCILIFLIAALAGIFINYDAYALFLVILLAGVAFTVYAARLTKSFLFLVYAFVAGYIGITYALTDTVLNAAPVFWSFYLVASCGAFVFFIIRYRNYFKREA